MSRRVSAVVCSTLFLALILAPAALAIQPNQSQAEPGYDLSNYEMVRPGGSVGVGTLDAGRLPEGHALRTGWQEFVQQQNGGWKIRLDDRSGLPALVT